MLTVPRTPEKGEVNQTLEPNLVHNTQSNAKHRQYTMRRLGTRHTECRVHELGTQYTLGCTARSVRSTQVQLQYSGLNLLFRTISQSRTIHSTPYSVHHTPYSIHTPQYTVHRIQYTILLQYCN